MDRKAYVHVEPENAYDGLIVAMDDVARSDDTGVRNAHVERAVTYARLIANGVPAKEAERIEYAFEAMIDSVGGKKGIGHKRFSQKSRTVVYNARTVLKAAKKAAAEDNTESAQPQSSNSLNAGNGNEEAQGDTHEQTSTAPPVTDVPDELVASAGQETTGNHQEQPSA